MDELKGVISILFSLMLIVALLNMLPIATTSVSSVSSGSPSTDIRIELEGDTTIDALNSEGSYTVFLKQGLLGIAYESVDIYKDNSTLVLTVRTDSGGRADFTIRGQTLGIGSHKLSVVFGNKSDYLNVYVYPYAWFKFSTVAQTDPLYDKDSMVYCARFYVDDKIIKQWCPYGSAITLSGTFRVTINENHTVKLEITGHGNVTGSMRIELEGQYTLRNGRFNLSDLNGTATIELIISTNEQLKLSWWYP